MSPHSRATNPGRQPVLSKNCPPIPASDIDATTGNFRHLRSRGRTVRKTIDCLIATFCIEHHHALLHSDRDFDAFEELLNLNVVHP